MPVWLRLQETATAELTSADIWNALDLLNRQNITIWSVTVRDDVTAVFTVRYRDVQKIQQICKKHGDTFRVIQKNGMRYRMKKLVHRPVLTGTILLVLALSVFLPSKILFVSVEGNDRIPENLILAASEESGLQFGVSRRTVRSERVKNVLLSQIPQLQWVGVNTEGCSAVISVREHTEQPEQKLEEIGPCNIIAAQDGVILSGTALKGSLLCRPGQAVKKGEILISGYTDCGICIRAEQAAGEIYAETVHEVSVRMPNRYCVRKDNRFRIRNISILFGKKRINLWKGSGIWDSSCGRIYKEQAVVLPGGFQLPVVFCWELAADGDFEDAVLTEPGSQGLLREWLRKYLLEQLDAGSVLLGEEFFRDADGCFQEDGTYHCRESIGRVYREQIGEYHGKTN